MKTIKFKNETEFINYAKSKAMIGTALSNDKKFVYTFNDREFPSIEAIKNHLSDLNIINCVYSLIDITKGLKPQYEEQLDYIELCFNGNFNNGNIYELLTVIDATRMMNISEPTFRKHVLNHVKTIKLGTTMYILRSSLDSNVTNVNRRSTQ